MLSCLHIDCMANWNLTAACYRYGAEQLLGLTSLSLKTVAIPQDCN